MNGLGGVADKGPLYMYIKEMVLGGISPKIPPPQIKKSQISIASAHIPILRNNPAKFITIQWIVYEELRITDFGGTDLRTDGRDGRTRVT